MENFKKFVSDFQASKGFKEPLGFGICRVEIGKKSKKILSATYPVLNWRVGADSKNGGQNGDSNNANTAKCENLGSFCVFMDSISKDSKILETPSEAVYGITKDFIEKALAHYKPFLAEAVSEPSTHKNIQVVLELKKAFERGELQTRGGAARYRLCVIYKDEKCQSVESAYAKLLALSLGKAPLRSLMLDGIFGLLSNVAWSGNTPYELDWLRENEIALKMSGRMPAIDFVDKFPRYLMQVIPQFDNIRLLDTAKTRFGAYLGKGGYTQMPGASYVNFNAGAMGACMNEGRISSSVVIGEGTDIGGGASILGVLSGGNTEPISIGRDCLLGVNSATGISLGDGCIVDGGIAVLAGTIFAISADEAKKIAEINPGFEVKDSGLYKGRELSKRNGIHFRMNSQTGQMIAFRSNRKIELNSALH